MANVKICDRCGHVFDEKRSWFDLTPIQYILGVATTKYLWGGGIEDRYDKFDICPRCMGDLKRFIKGEATDAVVKE